MAEQHADIYPWLLDYWAKLNRYLQHDRLPSALMLHGDEGLGLVELACAFANRVCCLQPNNEGMACGQCASCLLFNAGSYPDFYHLQPEDGKSTIRIDAIRELSANLSLSAQYTKPRVVLIDTADAMPHQAANSLLKTLEEPSDNTCLILIAHNLSKVPLTIRSRCQLLSLKTIDRDQACSWLELSGCQQAPEYLSLANGAPLLAQNLAQLEALDKQTALFKQLISVFKGQLDPLLFAEACFSHKELPVLQWLIAWFTDALKCAHGCSSDKLIKPSLAIELKILTAKLELKQLHQILDKLMQLSELESTQVNQQLMFEEFAVCCYSLSLTKG